MKHAREEYADVALVHRVMETLQPRHAMSPTINVFVVLQELILLDVLLQLKHARQEFACVELLHHVKWTQQHLHAMLTTTSVFAE